MSVEAVTVTRSQGDARVLRAFVELWCEDHHGERRRAPWEPRGPLGNLLPGEPPRLCEECRDVLGHALGRRLLCPHDPKPACKHCRTPCYRVDHRDTMRRIMRYSGLRLILRGRLDLIYHYFF